MTGTDLARELDSPPPEADVLLDTPGAARVPHRLEAGVSSRPLSMGERIADQLRAAIGTEHQPGEYLPSERQLALRYDVIRDAVGELRNEGLLVTVPGSFHQVRPARDERPLTLHPGDRVTVRMPTGTERREMGLERGIPLIEVQGRSGPLHIYSAAGLRLETARPEARGSSYEVPVLQVGHGALGSGLDGGGDSAGQ